MSEWWTYRPSDFLMFAPRTYWRLFELHNTTWWPAQPVLLLAVLAWGVWLATRMRTRRPVRTALRVGAAGLAAASAFVAWAFLLLRYAPINGVAEAFGVGFMALALGLAALASRADPRLTTHGLRRRIGALLGAWAMLGHPLLAAVSGRPGSQAEVFGLAPDPTAIATLGFLLVIDTPSPVTRALARALWALVLAWCVISAATLWTMGSAQGWVLLVAAAFAGVAATSSRRSVGV